MIPVRFLGEHAALACLCLPAFVPVPVLAQPTQVLVVTGTREPLAPERLAADVVVIDAETLRETRADSLADVLRREAGVQLSRSGGPGQSTGIFLRGAASQQSVVLVDGVRIGSATLGYAALESLALAQVDRIEVLRGPGSSLYGADAVGGVVQVFTKSGSAGAPAEGRIAFGGYGSREASLGLRGAEREYDYAVTLSGERSRGVSALRPGDLFGNYNPDRDGYRSDSGQLRLGWRPAAGQHLGLLVLHTKLDTQYDSSVYGGPPDYAQDPSPDFRTRRGTDVQALDWRGGLGDGPVGGLVGSARITRSSDDERSGAAALDHFRTTRVQLAAQIAWQAGAAGQFVAALEDDDSRAHSSSYAGDVSRRNRALVAEWTGASGAWAWQGDLRRDRSSDFGAVGTGRLGGSVELAPQLRLRALAGNTFRAPSFNDLYFPGYGVATLQPERGRSVELGLSWQSDAGAASATLFRNRVRDLVGYESDRSRCPPDPAYDFGCAGNTSRARLQGATLAAARREGALALKAQLDFLEARDELTGARLPRRAAHQGTLGADWNAGRWSCGASLLRLGARPDGGKWLAAETTIDLSASWTLAPAWRLQARLANATDRRLEPARDYQGLGRQGWLVLRYEGPS